MPTYRTAGVLLLLTALATAISVVARLIAGADDTPFTDSMALAQTWSAGEIVWLEVMEKLVIIEGASVAYGTGGAARLVGGLALLAASVPLWRGMHGRHPAAMTLAAVLLAASGIASAVSGASAVALALLAPELREAAVLTPTGTPPVTGAGDELLAIRWITGSLGFTLAGLGLVGLGPAQWRAGGILRVSAVVGAALGVGMLFIWVDAATIVHRITGIGFLIWLILAGLWLVAGRVRPRHQGEPMTSS